MMGRYILAHLKIENDDIIIVNVYGPNSDDGIFYENLFDELDNFSQYSILMGGDFNVCLTNLDKQGGRPHNFSHKFARNVLLENVDRLGMVDVWRNLNPNLRRYTWRQRGVNISCRLDYFLISLNIANCVKTTDIMPGFRTDHSLIYIEFSKSNEKRGPGFFKLNVSLLLQKEYVDKIKDLINIKKQEYKEQNVEPDLLWETLKSDIRGETIKYSSIKKKQKEAKVIRIEKEIKLLEEVNDIYRNEQCENRITQLKSEMQDIYEERCNGILTRAKVRWLKEGEKNTKYFIGLEKRNYQNKNISQLITNESETITNAKEILKEQKHFYQSLYSKKQVNLDKEEQSNFFVDNNNIPKLNEYLQSKCEGLITKEECEKIVKLLPNGKSPGTDSLPAEFYKIFWNEISDILLESINFSYTKKELSISQKQGIITLLPKSDRDIRYLKNWRPISLLNTDYKIITKCLAERLKNVLPFLIHSNQTGFLKNRYIGSNIRLLLDLIEYTNETNEPGMILSVDFEKAFDTVSWDFLENCLVYFNFGESFINWIKIIQKDAKSCVINNGWSSDMFTLCRGVRQGCPLSPYLFLICSEILGIGVRNCKDINGIQIQNDLVKLIQFADDTQFLLDGSESSLHKTISFLTTFEQISGLKINFEKSELVKLGQTKNVFYAIENQIKAASESLKVLGIKIPISGEIQDLIELNYTPLLHKIKTITKTWSKRNLTYYGKATIVKSLILPQLIYQLTNLPSPSNLYLKEVDDIIFRFIWDNKRPKIKRTQLYLEYSLGGLKIPNIFVYCKSLKLRWIKALVDVDDYSAWKQLFLKRYDKMKLFIFKGNIAENDVKQLNIKSSFWLECIKIWVNIHFNDTESISFKSIHPLCMLWFNSNLKINGKLLFYAEWYQKGIVYIKDLMDENETRFLDYYEFQNKYELNTTFVTFYGIINTICKKYVDEGVELYDDLKINKLIQAKSTSKAFYSEILSKNNKHRNRKCFDKWQRKLGKQIDWEEAFSNIYVYTIDPKLRHFQFKILHDVFPNNKILKKLGLTDNDKCDFCKEHVDSVEHYLWECSISKQFWHELQIWLQNIFQNTFTLTFENVLLGHTYENQNNFNLIINYITLNAKYFVHCCKWTKKIPSLPSFKYVLKQKELIERNIALSLSKLEKHMKKWEKVKESLSLI